MLDEHIIGEIKQGKYVINPTLSGFAESIPCYDGGSFNGIYRGGDNCYIVCIDKTNNSELSNYVSKLCDEGYSISADNKIADNLFFTLENGNTYINVYFISYAKSVKIIAEPYYKYTTDSTYIENVKPAIFASSCCDRNFYVRLPDNTLVIIDGGWRTEDWSLYNIDDLLNGMYNEMSEILGNTSTINVSLWIITHEHDDHGQVIQYLYTKKLCEKFNIKRILFNFPDNVMINKKNDTDHHFIEQSWEKLRKWHDDAGKIFPYEEIYYNCPFYVEIMDGNYGDVLREAFKHYNAEVIKAHSGMRFNMSGVIFEILHTPDDDMPAIYKSVNDTSIVIKMTYQGSSMLWLGDMGSVPSDSCVKMYGEYLKSDAVQVSHHGWGSATEEFYELASPSILFWNNSEFGFKYADNYQGYGKTLASTKLYDMDCVKYNYFCNKIKMQKAYLPIMVNERRDVETPKLYASSSSDRAFYIRTTNNKIILIDAGIRSDAAKHDWYKKFADNLYQELSNAVKSEKVEIIALFSCNAKLDNNLFLAQLDCQNVHIRNIVCGELSELYHNKSEQLIMANVGDRFDFDGVKIEIMQTKGSLVFSAVYGSKMIFTGEMTDSDSLNLIERYGDKLKCDIVIVANHGYSECGVVNFYQKCNAKIQFWGNSEYGFRFFKEKDGYEKNEIPTQIYKLENCINNIFCDCISPQSVSLLIDNQK